MGERYRVFALWGAHRSALKKTGSGPTSVDKGVPELAALGHDVVSIYPRDCYDRLPWILRKALLNRGRYILASIILLLKIRTNDVIYTSDGSWAQRVSRLRTFGLIKSRFVFKLAGFDFNWRDIDDNPRSIHYRHLKIIIKGTSAIFNSSSHETDRLIKTFKPAARKVLFHPVAVDTAFYAEIRRHHQKRSFGIVAVGSDCKRDWNIIVEIARHGIPTTIVTEDRHAKDLVDSLGDSRPAGLTLAYRVGMHRSAEIMAGAKALLIATLPNERFSGSTTVGVAAALRKPLILDERYDLAGYGLVPSENCEAFVRGDVASLIAAVGRVCDDPAHAEKLAHEIGKIAEDFDVNRYAAALSAAFSPHWEAAAHRQAIQRVQPVLELG